jgi:hypothetical protein
MTLLQLTHKQYSQLQQIQQKGKLKKGNIMTPMHVLFTLFCHFHVSLLDHKHLSNIWVFHGGDYEEWCLLGCYAVWLL